MLSEALGACPAQCKLSKLLMLRGHCCAALRGKIEPHLGRVCSQQQGSSAATVLRQLGLGCAVGRRDAPCLGSFFVSLLWTRSICGLYIQESYWYINTSM